MVEETSEEEILNHLLDTAHDRWGVNNVKTILTSFKPAASAISTVDNAHLKPEDEPIFQIILSRRAEYSGVMEKED